MASSQPLARPWHKAALTRRDFRPNFPIRKKPGVDKEHQKSPPLPWLFTHATLDPASFKVSLSASSNRYRFNELGLGSGAFCQTRFSSVGAR